MAKRKKEEVVVDKEEPRPDEAVVPDAFTFTLPVSRKEVTVKPWSWGDFTKIASSVDEIFDIVENSGLEVSELGKMVRTQDEIQNTILSGGQISTEALEDYNKAVKPANYVLTRLMTKLSDFVVPILVSATDMAKKDIEKLNPTDIHTLAMTVYYVNPTVLGNVYQPLGMESAGGLEEELELEESKA